MRKCSVCEDSVGKSSPSMRLIFFLGFATHPSIFFATSNFTDEIFFLEGKNCKIRKSIFTKFPYNLNFPNIENLTQVI